MGRVQSSVGLITGIPIQETVDNLLALQAQPRDTLVARQKVLGAEQSAVTDLTALVLGVQFAVRRLSNADLLGQKTVTSSQPQLLTATAGNTAVPGNYQFVPARLAQTHQVISTGLAARDEALGGGTVAFRLGGHVDTAVSLADLNGGAGVTRGQIRLTDRSGATAIVDLRFAQTIDDVLTAINSAVGTSIEALADGDRLRLIDHSGGTGNLRVAEVGGGTTAADLGLAGINAAASTADGQSLVTLFAGQRLAHLRDGQGLSLRPELPDLAFQFRDGTSLQVDLDPADEPAPQTVGQLLDRLNAADPARLAARIAADGKRIEIMDLTSGGGSFAVSSPSGGSLAEELGLTGPAAGGTITGQRLVSGLKTTLLSSLAGGRGLGTLGALQLTDRSGATASINLSSAESLDDVIRAINNAGLGIEASYNAARNGLQLTDTTGQTTSNLIAANGDATNTATRLGLAGNVAAAALQSGSLDRQSVSRNTRLETYHNGGPIGSGSFVITDSSGQSGAVNLTVLKPQTIGDILDAINGLALGVEARINDAGDGIALIDTAGGSGTLTVADSGAGQAAAHLRIAGRGTATTVNGQPAQLLDGSTTIRLTLDADDTLDDLVAKINAAGGPATASILSESSGSLPHHLALQSNLPGRAGELLIDGSALGLSFRDLAAAQDAAIQIGTSAAAGSVVASSSNRFDDLLPGLDVTLLGSSSSPVTVTVASSSEGLAGALQTFVDNYNKLRDKLGTYTAFDPDAGTKGTLFGSAETLRIDNELARLATGEFRNDGTVRSLAELGVSINDQGKLAFDKAKFQARFEADADAVTEFFADQQRGFAAQADAALERLVGKNQSLLVSRAQTLNKQLETVGERIDAWNARLDRSRERLLLQFFRLEEVVSRIRNNLSALDQIQFIGPIQK